MCDDTLHLLFLNVFSKTYRTMSGSYSVVVYDWAGHYRLVNMGKAEFHFAAAHLIPNLMKTFEKKFFYLSTCTV